MYFGLYLIMVDISIQTDVCAQTELFPLSYITTCCYKYKTLKNGAKTFVLQIGNRCEY